MLYARFKVAMRSFWNETRGSFTVESVIAIPLLFWATAATFEFFEVHRYKSAREKATYAIADMISRETSQAGLTSVYMDNALTMFDAISNDEGANQIRVSVVQYDQIEDIYEIVWSEIRGQEFTLEQLETSDVEDDHDRLPIVDHGDQIIVVESNSFYEPLFGIALDRLLVDTRMFTSIRFAPQVCYEGICAPANDGTTDTSDDDDAASNS
ncbi:TadE/TadG family type IV pilus assembly protein [Roseovarius phycicola]|uniref:Pilus assembly protein n=1 Tax=Roseovarius phycicola TaxID=3080976 RepID=A0ABZ2HDL9_9RHOB